jgi:hypothetical protein
MSAWRTEIAIASSGLAAVDAVPGAVSATRFRAADEIAS